jgi:hypothetical protein
MTISSRAGGRLPRWFASGAAVMLVVGAVGVVGAPARARSVRSPRVPERPESAPAVEYSTYLGGVSADQAWNIAVDRQGNSYIAGYTASSDFPTFHALQPVAGGSGDAFVAKFDPSGALVYSTYLGGNNMEIAWGIAVDDQGAAYVVGMTGSADFPVVHAFQSSYHGGWDAFVAKIAPDGQSLVYSTFLGGGGEEFGYAIAVDAAGAAYVTGETQSSDFPLLGAIQTQLGGSEDAFVTKLAPGGDALVYSTYLGGALGGETGLGIAVDPAGRAHVTGWTTAGDFPTANAFQGSLHGLFDVFVTEFDSSGGALVFSTFLGGSDYEYVDEGEAVTTDVAGDTYVTGFTGSPDFPVFDAYQFFYGGQIDAFVTELDPGGQMVFSSFLGGSNSDVGYGIALDPGQRISAASRTRSSPGSRPAARCSRCRPTTAAESAVARSGARRGSDSGRGATSTWSARRAPWTSPWSTPTSTSTGAATTLSW